MKLVVGLGNPGRRYADTRHNVGYQVVAELARRHGATTPRAKFHGETVEVDVAETRCILLSPTTYMNRSGLSVLEAKQFYKLDLADLLVVCDDFNLPLAKLRIRAEGSAGGQKGLADIIQRLGTEQFPRLRFGIGSVPEHWNGADYVLSKFTKQELPVVEEAVRTAAEAVAFWVREDIGHCMNRYN